MVRPKKCRMVASIPGATYYKPAGIPLRFLNEVRLSIEEAEALRLKELEGLEQAEGAVKMGISRPTFQRVLSSARRKVAEALLNGKAIRIEGGNFQVIDTHPCCHRDHIWVGQLDSNNAGNANLPVCKNPRAHGDSSSDAPIQTGIVTQSPSRASTERVFPSRKVASNHENTR